MNELGRFIKKRLIDQGRTQVELADRIGVKPQYLSSIIRGKKGPGKYTPALARELGIREEELRRLCA
ncbi:MAG: helix-turn-helix transcriptional regulator [Eubacteriales bacterium]|nr:helix-turn-helix transcriptional regulator [Eubacteriales bacterium]